MRLLSNILWTVPPAAFTWWVVSSSWDGIKGGYDRGGAAAFSLVISAGLIAGTAFCVYQAVKAGRDFDPSRPGAGNDVALMLSCQAVFAFMIAVAAPRWFDLIAVGNEGATKGNLKHVRETFDAYAAKKGRPPRLERLVEEGLLERLPPLRYRHGIHEPTSETVNLEPGVFTDSGKWGYAVEGRTPIFVDCTHTDMRQGTAWTNY